MRIFCTLALPSAVILNAVGFSTQFECLPNGDAYPGILSFIRSPTRRQSPHSRYHSPNGLLPPAEPPLRSRSRSPPLRQAFSRVLGFRSNELKLLRLIPNNNVDRVFELRTYVFPLDKPIRLRTKDFALSPMPTEEQIVLSTSHGDVCAILARLADRKTIFRALLQPDSVLSVRVKINIYSGAVEKLTPEEIADCPVGTRIPVKKSFKIFRV